MEPWPQVASTYYGVCGDAARAGAPLQRPILPGTEERDSDPKRGHYVRSRRIGIVPFVSCIEDSLPVILLVRRMSLSEVEA